MAFVRYVNNKLKYAVPTVSVWPRGAIAFSKSAMKEFYIYAYSHVVLFFDEGKRRVGIKLTNEEKSAGAIKICLRDRQTSFISVIPFLRMYNIMDVGGVDAKVKKYPLTRDKETKLLVFEV